MVVVWEKGARKGKVTDEFRSATYVSSNCIGTQSINQSIEALLLSVY